MNDTQYRKNLTVPDRPVDVVLDTDTYNEVDDQFAVAYLLASGDKLRIKGLYAAPFFNHRATSPADGMEKSYGELCRILTLANRSDLLPLTFRGAETYLPDEQTPVDSPAVRHLVELAEGYSPEEPLYVIAIGAITNIASALLLKPSIAENIVIVWLGGHAYHWPETGEFNMVQDIAAARVVFDSAAPLVQLPCGGVVSAFTVSLAEMAAHLEGRSPLCDFLVNTVRRELGEGADNLPLTRVIWDVTAVGWLLNEDERLMRTVLLPCPIPEYNRQYTHKEDRRPIAYVREIHRDALAVELFRKLQTCFN